MSKYQNELKLAINIVKQATKITEWFREKGFKSYEKQDESPVTLADYASQIFIINKLKHHFPEDQIIAEESYNLFIDKLAEKIIKNCYALLNLSYIDDIKGILNYRGLNSKRQWTIDPIDGTKGFQKGLSYAVGIGFMVNSELIASVIGVPNYDKRGLAIFSAERHEGAKASYGDQNFMPIHVSKINDLKKARMCHSLHYDQPWVMDFAKLAKINNFIRIDSMAKFCMIADGSADLYIKPMYKNRSFSWDFLPGNLIVEESGGTVSDLNGKNLKFDKEQCLLTAPGLIASNGNLHNEILNYIKYIDF